MTKVVKFSEMPYHRPDLTEAEERVTRITRKLVDAADYEEAREAFLMMEAEHKRITTQANLALIRHSIDTRVEFYDKEMTFWNGARPRLRATVQKFDRALLESPFRAKLEEEFGAVAFLNIEIEDRSFSPELIPDMKEVNDLSQEYMKIIASAQIPFEGGVYTLSQLTPFKRDRDDARRLAAWKAEGKWYKEHQEDLDRIYDRMVHLRDRMGKTLGYRDFTELGYDRMNRNCYRREEVEKFRAAVRKYIVPVADRICRKQAERIGVSYPLSFADLALEFRSGNPAPAGTQEEILESDLLLFSFPLYSYGMPAPLKALLDRTMPLSSMAMQKVGDRYEHVGQADFRHLRYLMICGCGFPNSRHNFEPAVLQFKLCFPCDHTIITVPESPMFNAPEADVVTKPRLDLVRKAGEQYARTGEIEESLLAEIGSPMIPEEQYAAIVNGGE